MAIPTAHEVVEYAEKYIRPQPYYRPNIFTQWYGYNGPWCAMFVYFCLNKTGGGSLLSGCTNKAYVPTIWEWAKAHKYTLTRKSKAIEGDLAVFDWQSDGEPDHIGFVIKDNGDGTISTVEGNTSSVSDGNGNCVQHRTRDKKTLRGLVRLPYRHIKPADGKKGYQFAFPVLPKKGYLKYGDSGTQVSRLQSFLRWYGWTGLKCDGIYGAHTEQCVKAFQKREGLVIDGICGPNTLKKMKAVKK